MASDWRLIASLTANDKNLVTNPSAETDTTGYSTGGTNTLAVSTEQQYRGKNSLKVTYSNSTTLLSWTQVLLETNTLHYVKARLYVPDAYNGGNISFSIAGYASGVVNNTVTIYTDGTSTQDAWLELKATITPAADLSGTMAIVAASVTSGSVYIDALSVSTNDSEYFDGDDDMAYWEGNRHASISVMDWRNRKHGSLTDPESTGIKLGYPTGVDFPPLNNQYSQRSQGRGVEVQGVYVGAPSVSFPIIIPAALNNEAQYHQRKKAFEELIKFNRTPGNQLMRWQYLGANADVPNYLDLKVDDFSMTKETRAGKTGKGVLRMTAPEQQWYEMGDQYAALTRSDSLDVSYILGWLDDGTGFSNLGDTGTAWPLVVVAAENGDIYLGGIFENWDGQATADYLVRRNRSTGAWSPLFTTPLDSFVRDMLILDDGDLVFVGNFTSVDGSPFAYAARWDGTTVTAFGTGFNDAVRTVAFDYQRGFLYFGGDFTSANGVAHNRIVKYRLSDSTFIAMGTGTNQDVYDIYIDPPTGDVYIGGEFTTVNTGSLTVNRVARWDHSDSDWNIVGPSNSPGTNGIVNTIAGDGTYVYVGGEFTTAGGNTMNYITRIKRKGKRFEALGGQDAEAGLNGSVQRMIWDAEIGKLLISGVFTSVNSNYAIITDATVYWNGSTWEALGLDFPASTTVFSFVRHKNGDYFYVFSTTGTMVVPSALNEVENTGTDAARPVFYFDSSADVIGTEYATLSTLANRITGAKINFNDLRVLAGSVVIVDIERGQVFRRVGQNLIDLTEGTIRRDSDLANFALLPGVTNEILISCPDTNGTPTITAYLLYRKRHWSISGTAT